MKVNWFYNSWLNKTALIRKSSSSQNNEHAYIHSLEGDIYLLELESNGVSQWVESPVNARPKRFSCLAEAKKYAKSLGVNQIRIALETPYDEMIGLASCS